MDVVFQVVSVDDSEREHLEHESPSYDLAVKEAEAFFCKVRIYAKMFVTEFGRRKSLAD